MNSETKKLFSERILTIVNKYLKHGSIVQHLWPMLAKKELEKLILEAYEQGRKDQRNEGQLDAVIDKIKGTIYLITLTK